MSSLNSLLAGGVKSIQRGVITFPQGNAATTVTATVTAVDTAKAVLIMSGFSMSGTTDGPVAGSVPRLELISTTQIRLTRENGGVAVNGASVAWQLVEFY
ncbi:MAG: hypothetical protein ACN6O3_21205 [Comamonas sp.]